MSWFSKAVHTVTDPIANLFGGGGNNDAINAQTKAMQDATAQAKASSDAALVAQQQANAIAQAASIPTSDNESSRAAQDEELRKRLQGQNGIGLPTQFGAPPVGFRMLSGQ